MENAKFYYTLLVMANVPHPETITVSFTLPRALSDAVERKARANLTNKSDIIRRALLHYLPQSEAEEVMRAIDAHAQRSTVIPMREEEASKGAKEPATYKAKKKPKP